MSELQSHPPPLWTRSTLEDPHAVRDKPRRVREMFAAIARCYDLNNRVHSLWRDEAWRRAAVRAAGVRSGDEVLDLACGTGDLTHAFARRSRAARIVGVDFTQEMLDLAEHKRSTLHPGLASRVSYINADAMALPFDDASFDVVSIAFGIRNVLDPEAALREMHRVLRPGGRLVILEFDRPRLAPVRWFNTLYSATIMPRTATWIARDRSGAYRYLPKSIETFMTSGQLRRAAEGSGFEHAGARSLSLGICACVRATKPVS